VNAAADPRGFALGPVVARRYRLRLRRPLATARGAIAVREGVLLELRDERGVAGFGEAAPLPGFHRETAETCATALARALRPDPVPRPLAERLGAVREALQRAPAALAAADTALHDLAARRRGSPLAAALAGRAAPPRTRVEVNALLAAASPEATGRAGRAAVASGYATLKLKILEDGSDGERLRALRAAIGPAPAVRIDANGAWDFDTALRRLEAYAVHALQIVEQPLAPGDPDALAALRARSPVAIAADEDAVLPDAATAVIEARAADWIVLKPTACGGVGRALDLARRARAAGLEVVVTSFIDGAIGRAAALHLAAALEPAPPACGLATGALLAEDLARGPEPRNGFIELPRGAGLGVSPEAGRSPAEGRAWI